MRDNWKHRSDNMKCKTCMWFVPKVPQRCTIEMPHEVCNHPKGHSYDLGRCRRHAPTMNGFPVVFVNDWCGDHKLDENAAHVNMK